MTTNHNNGVNQQPKGGAGAVNKQAKPASGPQKTPAKAPASAPAAAPAAKPVVSPQSAKPTAMPSAAPAAMPAAAPASAPQTKPSTAPAAAPKPVAKPAAMSAPATPKPAPKAAPAPVAAPKAAPVPAKTPHPAPVAAKTSKPAPAPKPMAAAPSAPAPIAAPKPKPVTAPIAAPKPAPQDAKGQPATAAKPTPAPVTAAPKPAVAAPAPKPVTGKQNQQPPATASAAKPATAVQPAPEAKANQPAPAPKAPQPQSPPQKQQQPTPVQQPLTQQAGPAGVQSQALPDSNSTSPSARTRQRRENRVPPKPQPQLERQHLPAGPPRARAALNEKSQAPSIGGLIYSMQAKPSNTPYIVAAVTSALWLVIGGLLGWVLVGQSLSDFSAYKSVINSPSIYMLAACVIAPIALFWFIAQLVWRSQEMKLMASAMTEVAIRLAEPDKMAEQKVASVGQTIRRQVSAMDDAISRALGRAGELESLVHNEVAALERSYSQNEFIIRNLLQELVSEREAIAQNSVQVKQTLEGVGGAVTQKIQKATEGIGQNLAQHGTMSALKLQQAGDDVTKALQTTTMQTVAVKQKIAAELPVLLDKMNSEQQKLGKVIDGANKNLGALNKGLVERTKALDTTLAQRAKQLDDSLVKRTGDLEDVMAKHASELNRRLVQKVKALDASLAMRTKAMDKTLAGKAKEIDRTFLVHRDDIDTSLQTKAQELDASITRQAKAMDASLTEKARAIDTALNKRVTEIGAEPQDAEARKKADLSMLRGSEALQRAMSQQSGRLEQTMASNSRELESSIEQQNAFSPEITKLTDKHNSLVREHADLAARTRKELAAQSQDLQATARLLSGDDMKMSSMMGPQQNKARAILADIGKRTMDVEKSLQQNATALDNSLALTDETANQLRSQLTANASPRAERAIVELDHICDDSRAITDETKKEMEADYQQLAQKVVEAVSSMSRSTSRTRVLPGEVATKSTDIRKSVDEQVRALDALAQISGAAIGANQATATGVQSAQAGMSAHGGPAGGHTATSMPSQPQGGHAGHLHGQGHPQGRQGSPMPPQPSHPARMAPTKPPVAPVPTSTPTSAPAQAGTSKQPSQWSFGDLLARVADTDADTDAHPLPTYRPASASSSTSERQSSGLSLDPLDVLRMDDIARMLDSHTASLAWNRYQAGERAVFSKRLYNSEGQKMFDDVVTRYSNDNEFHATVEKYVGDFEQLMSEAEEKDPSGRITQNYVTSETGRVYLVLAHASGRLG